jgi:glycosyltransferase involved in cell wall biosynthesis
MIETVEKPTFTSQDFALSKKRPGISAIVRLRDEEEYLEQALNSILPFFDEFVIVFNQCSDRTPEIVEAFARENPQRVRAFHYVPKVFPQGSREHRVLPPDHVSSLVHYYNFALSQASCQVRAKWDGDMIAAPRPFGGAVERLRSLRPGTLAWWLSPWRLGFWWYMGVNLWDRDGETLVNSSFPTSGLKKDHGFWPAGRRHVFRHHRWSEYFRWRWLFTKCLGFVFFHVKGMKRDRGVGVYDLDKNPDSPYRRRVGAVWTDPTLVTFEEHCRVEPAASTLPHPEALGIRSVRS